MNTINAVLTAGTCVLSLIIFVLVAAIANTLAKLSLLVADFIGELIGDEADETE